MKMTGIEWLIKNNKYIIIGNDKILQISSSDLDDYANYFKDEKPFYEIVDCGVDGIAKVCKTCYSTISRTK
jgi:hypothetical protein